MSSDVANSSATLPTRRKRRWFQFGLRFLLGLTLAVAAYLGGARYYWQKLDARRAEALAKIKEMDGEATLRTSSPTWVDWLLLRTEHVELVRVKLSGVRIYDEELQGMLEFPELEELSLEGCDNLRPEALDYIAKMKGVKTLHLPRVWFLNKLAKTDLLHVQELHVAGKLEGFSADRFTGLRNLRTLHVYHDRMHGPSSITGVRGFLALSKVTVDGVPAPFAVAATAASSP